MLAASFVAAYGSKIFLSIKYLDLVGQCLLLEQVDKKFSPVFRGVFVLLPRQGAK